MDYSFYGGRRGAAFVITARYSSIQEMVDCFKQGNNYSDVNFDEYVIIDADRNSADNGKIYRRGYSYQDELGGAQYIGQISGPAGLAPQLEMSTLEEIEKLKQNEQEGFDYRYSEGEYNPSNSLIPGKQGDSFNDAIKWMCCSVRDKEHKDTIAYIGLSFPYTVIDYTANSVDPYYNRSDNSDNFTNNNLVTRTDDQSHPFYEKWNISVPKGIKGDAFKNFRVIDASSSDGIEPYSGQENDRAGKGKHTFEGENASRQIAVYDYYHYDKDGNGEPVSIYLGDYNMISNVAFDDDGTVRIAYSHDDDQVWSNKFKWIKNISITKEGLFTVNYNYGEKDTQYQTTLSWIDKVDFTDDGTIRFNYNDGVTQGVEFAKKIKWIKDVILADDGTLTVKYNNGDPDKIFSKKIKWVRDVKVNTGNAEGEGNQKVHITYNDNSGADIGNPLNYIMRMAIEPVSYHLLVLYSDPAKRQQIINDHLNATYEGRNDWHDCGCVKNDYGLLVGTNYEESHFADSSITGIISQLNKEIPNGFDSSDLDRHGKMVSVGNKTDNKKFFSFDYTKEDGVFKGWYYLGMIGDSNNPSVIAGKEGDPEIEQIAKTLPQGSIWMVIEGV